MNKKLIELIEQIGDTALQKHIPLTSDMIAKHLVRNGAEVPVRCKDCVYFQTQANDWGFGFTVCSKEHGGMVTPCPDDFCSYGERKT